MKGLKGVLCLAALLLTLFCLVSCGEKAEDSRTALKVGGEKVTADEARYLIGNVKKDLGDAGADEIRDGVILQCRRNAAIRKLAKKHKVKLTSEEKNAVLSQEDSFRASYDDEEAYQKGMADAFLTPYSLHVMLETQALWQKLYETLTDEMSFVIRADDKTLFADIETNFRCAGQILLKNDEGDDPAENRRLAEEALAKLDGGGDFIALCDEYGEDLGMRDSGYYFTRGQLLTYFEDAAFSLEIGAHTGVIECPLGFAIVQRFPLDDSYVRSHLETLRTAYKARIFNEMLAETMDSLKITDGILDELITEG